MELVSSKNKLKEKYFKNMMSIMKGLVAMRIMKMAVRHETLLIKVDDLTHIFRPIAAQLSGAGGEKTTKNIQQDSPSHAHFFGDRFVTQRNMEGGQVSTCVCALYKESQEENNNVCKTNEELMICHIGSLHHQCNDLMSIKVAPANIVPLNKRTDCGIFMLKTMEMHIAGKCNKSATMLLNDDNIDTFRKAYAVQLYVGSADP
ncbi:hypothetical protein G4B88_009586 [Cannabis sativa]|uniref:Ubiquitin-like protease family profile domain-containing protein n=1 Tax=Cannabis sativa TaxID=3483 RepID=A0A7J6GEJ6_CANSA|nr:hypothetical protein G4B88_009586 [Cannabis sativa]